MQKIVLSTSKNKLAKLFRNADSAKKHLENKKREKIEYEFFTR